MAFHTDLYDTYVILGDPDVSPIWNWENWSELTSALDPLIEAARGKAALRSMQNLPDQQGEVKFGRIGWNKKGHQKWTHGSPVSGAESLKWQFVNVEMWAPSWTACQKENKAPDLFLEISNEATGPCAHKTLSFNPVIVLAVRQDLSEQIKPEVELALKALERSTKAKFCGYRNRPWGISCSIGFTDSIQDLYVSGLFKSGDRHTRDIGPELFEDEWEIIK